MLERNNYSSHFGESRKIVKCEAALNSAAFLLAAAGFKAMPLGATYPNGIEEYS